MASSLW